MRNHIRTKSEKYKEDFMFLQKYFSKISPSRIYLSILFWFAKGELDFWYLFSLVQIANLYKSKSQNTSPILQNYISQYCKTIFFFISQQSNNHISPICKIIFFMITQIYFSGSKIIFLKIVNAYERSGWRPRCGGKLCHLLQPSSLRRVFAFSA